MLTPCFVLLRADGDAIEAVRVYLSRDAADAAKNLIEWNRVPGRFQIAESKVELPEKR